MATESDRDLQATDGDLAEQVSRLEHKLEELAAAIERCRKVDLFSKAMLGAGAAIVVLLAVGIIRPEPLAVVGVIALLVSGTVLFGSNASTWTQAAADMKAAEALMSDLINRADLTLVMQRTAAPQRQLH
jgi:hypothetical protein